MDRIARFPVLIAAGVLASALASAVPNAHKDVHKTLPLEAGGRLEVSTYKGSITVSVWDRAEAEIEARIEPDGDDDEAATRVQETEIRIEGGGHDVRVKSDYDRLNHHHLFSWLGASSPLPFVRYTIHVPATARVDIDDYKSDTRIAGLRADLKLHTYKGSARIEGLDGAANIDTYKGEISVAFARYSHASRFETYKGAYEVTLPRDSRFNLEADGGRRGEVDSDFAVASHGRTRRGGESARGEVNGGGPALRFDSSRGSLRLRGL